MHKRQLYFARVGLVLTGYLLSSLVGAEPRFTDGEDIGVMIVGSITHENKAKNVALIKEVKTGRVKAVKTGFTVLGSYKVTEITPKYMVVAKGDKKLLVYQNKFAGEFASGRLASKPSSRLNVSESYTEDGFERKAGRVKLSRAYRDKLVAKDLPKILMQATAVPKIQNGRIIGFRILQIDAGSIYDKAGFQNNDVITSINGHNLTNVAAAVRLLQSMRNETNVEIEFMRNGSTQKMQMSVHHH